MTPNPARLRGTNFPVRSVAAAMLLLPLAAQTATAQQIPSAADPRRVEERFEPTPAPQSRPAIEVPAPEQAPPPDQAGQIQLTLSDVVIEGADALGTEQLRPLIDAVLERPITLLDLYQLRDAITNHYRNQGYVLSQAVIPAQRIRDGVARITVIEGFIHEVGFEGEFADRADRFAPYVARIKASRPLRLEVLERQVLLINDLGGVQARTVLKPAEGVTGGSNLVLVLERVPFAAALAVDNRGSESIGPWQADGMVQFNDISDFDTLTARAILAKQIDELKYGEITYERPIGSNGTVGFVGVRKSLSEPDINVLKVYSDSTTLRAGARHPLIRSRSETLVLDGEFALRRTDTETNFGAFTTIGRDQLAVASLGATYDVADRFGGANLLQLQATQGLGVLGARTNNPADEAVFTKFVGRARHDQPIVSGLVLELAAEGQYSRDRVPASEDFGIGGKTFGRAYDPSTITGDIGAAFRGELNYAIPHEIEHVNMVQPFVYADTGWTWSWSTLDRDSLMDQQRVSSAGVGIRVVALDRVSAQIDVARAISASLAPTNTTDPHEDSWGAYLSVVVRY